VLRGHHLQGSRPREGRHSAAGGGRPLGPPGPLRDHVRIRRPEGPGREPVPPAPP
jgi:hypothetical protein